MNNLITEIKITLEGTNNIKTEAEDRISEVEALTSRAGPPSLFILASSVC